MYSTKTSLWTSNRKFMVVFLYLLPFSTFIALIRAHWTPFRCANSKRPLFTMVVKGPIRKQMMFRHARGKRMLRHRKPWVEEHVAF